MIAPEPQVKTASVMAGSSRAPEVPSIALNVPVSENGARRGNVRRTMGSPEQPDEPYYRLPPKDARCPVCRVGSMKRRFTACGVFLGVALFPLGLIPCIMLREKRCNHCRHRPGLEEPWPE